MTDFHAVEDDHTVEDSEPTPKKSTRRGRRSGGSDRAAARASAERDRAARKKVSSAIERYEQFRDLEPARLKLAAALLGCSDTAADVTAYSLHPTPSASSPASVMDTFAAIRVQDPMDALVAAATVAEDKPALRGVWSLCATLLPDLPQTAPNSDPIHAGRDLARAAARLSDEDLEIVAAVTDLLL